MSSLHTQPTRHANPALHPCVRGRPVELPVRQDQAQNTALNTDPFWHSVELLKHGSRTFPLAQPLAVRLQQVDGKLWEASVEKLGIVAAGESPTAAFDEVEEEFAVIWDALAFESDETLTEDARQLKALLHQLVK